MCNRCERPHGLPSSRCELHATEEHNINNNESSDEGRQEVRDHFRTLFQQFYGPGTHRDGTERGGEATTTLLQLLSQLMPEDLQEQLMQSMDSASKQGCSDTFIDSLPRIPQKKLKSDDTCPICCSNFIADEYPLVVELPHCGHKFDFECVSMWLTKNTTCPMCRDDVTHKKELPELDTSKVELEEDWGMYG
ncbi:Zinc finger RING-type profile [Nakaseomyces glabratus]|nr:Zinc finger RING-type profile [Nakaseomyces glabratus]KAH7588024.1 Zinc finger RING-type profile [Nakaseomyces glabratus]KAH7592410.1 Zinc finger RING-type profile [Nakaseomyces glabratus]KAH7601056.1 Zinc finger RING-type profile [Nakaseomyces glabratus]KAH7601676.1 Zinc finger RING-type profile [Nakaseomyces glabratus]